MSPSSRSATDLSSAAIVGTSRQTMRCSSARRGTSRTRLDLASFERMYAGCDSGVAGVAVARFAGEHRASRPTRGSTRPAAISRPPTCSPTNAQPRNTATAGFTYAYVERSGVERVLQQPAVRRERDERAEDDEEEQRAERRGRDLRRMHAPALAHREPERRRAARPPSSICIAAPANGPRGSGATRAYAEPAAQAKDAKRSTAAPSEVDVPDGPARIATPTRPVAMPATAPSGSRMPKHARSIRAMKSGTLATSSAAVPDGTRCTAQATPPVSSDEERPPTIAAARHSRRPGRSAASSPRRAAQA